MLTTQEGTQALIDVRFGGEPFSHSSRQAIASSAKAGCPLCALIFSRFRGTWKAEATEMVKFKANFSKNKLLSISNATYEPGNITLSAFAIIGDPAEKYLQHKKPSKEVGTDTAMANAKGWMNECLHSHEQCSITATPLLPTRVLYVGGDGPGQLPHLYISEPDERDNYIALSYCWGGSQLLMTTTTTLENMVKGIDIFCLPQTIMDAIVVTKSLGIRYLWIDAICILQDDPVDKNTEINKMREVYQNSTITIVAASAEKVTDGFLEKRTRPSSVETPFHLPDGSFGTIHFQRDDDDDADFFHIYSEPLFRRGWAFQELLLSPRVLLYESLGHSWHCETNSDNESDGYDLHFNAKRSYTRSRSRATMVGDSLQEKQDIWKELVEEYSARSFTDFADRQPAIAGVAQELGEIWKDEYIAGFWKSTIAQNMYWQRNESYRVKQSSIYANHTDKIGSPSWSWLTAPYAVVLSSIAYQSDMEMEFIDCVPERSPDAPFGQVHGGLLTVNGKMITLEKARKNAIRHDWDIRLDYESLELGANTQLVLHHFRYCGTYCLVLRELSDHTFERLGTAMCNEPNLWINTETRNCHPMKFATIPDLQICFEMS